MTLKYLKPTTPSQRGTVLIDKSELWKGKPMKTLVKKLHSTGGRNNQGRITSRHKGGGAKHKYRIIDFKRNKFGVEGEVVRNEYDPNRSAFISLIKYKDGEYRYILAPQNLNIGSKILSDDEYKPKVIIRTGIGAERPLHPQYQHVGDYTTAFREMCTNIEVIRIEEPEDAFPAYRRAYEREDGKSTIVVEYGDYYGEK